MLESTGPKPVSGKQGDPEDVCEGQDAAAPEYGDFGDDVVGHVPCPWRNWYYRLVSVVKLVRLRTALGYLSQNS